MLCPCPLALRGHALQIGMYNMLFLLHAVLNSVGLSLSDSFAPLLVHDVPSFVQSSTDRYSNVSSVVQTGRTAKNVKLKS